MKKYAIIVAGGSGNRFGGDNPKQFQCLSGKPILMHTIDKFHNAGAIVTIVLPESQILYWEKLCSDYCFCTPYNIAIGGISRYESVRNGLSALNTTDDDIVAIHDGVRPLVSEKMILESYDVAAKHGSAIPVTPVTDSIRQISKAGSSALPRNELKAVQTPQTFRAEMLSKAYSQKPNPLFTDDASVDESIGKSVTLFDGETTNIKITRPIDLVIAEEILRLQQK